MYICIYKTQADSVVSGKNVLLISWLQFIDSRRETQVLKVFADHTIWLLPYAWRILWYLRSLLLEFRKTQLHLQQPKSKSMPQWQELNYLPLWSNLNYSVFKILKFSAHFLWAWRHLHSSSIFCLAVYYGDVDCHILCAQAKLYPMTMHQNLRASNSSKSNQIEW